MAKPQYDPSLDRQRLAQLRGELAYIIRAFCEPTPLISGGFEVLRRRCGKSPCRCIAGRLHETEIFLARTSGKRRLYKPTAELRKRVRKPTVDYSRLRRLRVRLGKLHREFLETCDRLRDFRLRDGARLVERVTE
jgi:hypothetical protein